MEAKLVPESNLNRADFVRGVALAAGWLLLSADPAGADEIYLTQEQALNLVLGKDVSHRYEPKDLPPELIADLKSKHLWGADKTQAHFFVGESNGKVVGYALIDSEVGKHLPITYIVGISPEGKITRVEMMVFREVRGWEARESKFMEQFDGIDQESDVTVGSKIKNVTGATLSSLAIGRGVKRALVVWKFFSEKKEL